MRLGGFLDEKTAIVGAGTTDFAVMYERDPSRASYGLGIDALKNALDDAGLEIGDIDGLLCCRMPSHERIDDLLDLRHSCVVSGYEGPGHIRGKQALAAE